MKNSNIAKNKRRGIGLTATLTLGFLVIILIGTLLLSLPISSADGSFTNPLDSAFTAVSSTCVTGLITLDTATHWNTLGHIVIITMIQIGGLGFMCMAVLLSLLVKRTVTPRERMLVAMSYNVGSYESTMQLVKRIALGTLAIEGAGALVLMTRFIPDFGVRGGIFKSVFHSVSAFCNAGFDIIGIGNSSISGMGYYADDYIVNITLSLLIIFGGIGFLVWGDIINFARTKKRLTVYSKFVLIITAALLALGTVMFAVFEWNNPATLGSLDSIPEKIVASFFQSVTWRTAGFAMFDNGAFSDNSQLLGVILMFIGGASGSTAGGVKVATVGILVYTVWCVAIGKKQTNLFGRNISDNSFVRAVSVIFVQLTVAIFAIMLISASSDFEIMDIVYEVISAVSTVGVTTGITPLLSASAKIIVMLLMYFGRVGVLTITFAVAERLTNQSSANMRYPDAKMPVG